MAVKPNMNVKDIDIYKMLWSPKGATKGILRVYSYWDC